MHKILMLTCGVLMISSITMADDTATETCANGAGWLVPGNVTGYKYCVSKKQMNWWNAYAWCDGMGRRLIDINKDCPNNNCSDLKFSHDILTWWSWTANPSSDTNITAYFTDQVYKKGYSRGGSGLAFCR